MLSYLFENSTMIKMINKRQVQSFSNKLIINAQRISKDGSGSLYLCVIIHRQKKNFPLHIKWPADKIDFKTDKLLPRFKKDPLVTDYNLFIQMEQARHTEIQVMYRLRNEELTIEKFTTEVLVFDTKQCFLTYLEYERNRRFKRKEIELKTFENANSCKLAIMRYDATALFKNINIKWMQGFKSFLETEPYAILKDGTRKYYKIGAIWRHIATTKSYLMRASHEPMICVDQPAVNFKNPKPKTATTYLTKPELRKLIILLDEDLRDIEFRVLQAFLFTCFTSLRISDVYRASADWQIEDGFIEFIPHKNRRLQRQIKIPLLPMAKKLISDQGFYFKLPNQSQYNETLKVLAAKAGINKNVTSHVGRHTFGFLYMVEVENIYGLQQLMGHSKLETTERYAHLDDDYKITSTIKIQNGFEDLMRQMILPDTVQNLN